MTNKVTIYLPLLNEGTEVWAPAQAERVGAETYLIVGTAPPDQEWAFPKDAVVRCEERAFGGGQTRLIAVERA